MEDVLNVYEKPYNQAEPVVCLDEKPTQLLSDARTGIAARKSGEIAKQDYEYVRGGTANIFDAVEPKAGKRITKVTENRKGPEFAKFTGQLAARYSDAKTIHLVMDNLSTHSRKSLTDYYGHKEGTKLCNRFTVHYTPTHASWLNQAEIDLNILTAQCLRKRRIPAIQVLRKEIRAWTSASNKRKIKIKWAFTKKKARKKFKYTI